MFKSSFFICFQQNAWLGLTDLYGNGEFSWISGHSVAYTNWADNVTDRTSLPCVAIDAVNDFKWIDTGCDVTTKSVALCRVY